MSHCKSIVFALSAFFFVGATVLGLGDAQAQPSDLTIDSSTGVAPAPPEPASAAPVAIAPAGDGEAENMYYGEYLDDVELEESERTHTGTVPTTHTVVTGDTLWDLSAHYFSTPWDWPKVWKLNPEIADPHWIYPGNIVRLREGGNAAPVPAINKGEGDQFDNNPQIASSRGYVLRQSAYIDLKDLEDAATVDGSIAEKSLLAAGDSVYLTYEEGKMPAVGTTLAVFKSGKKIKRDGKNVGAYVEVTGELRITFAKKGKRARAVITRSIDPVERGMRVGALELNFKDTQPVANDTKVDGEVVGLIGPDELIGAEAAIIIDRGSKDGVQVGNRFLVIRSGDAYKAVMGPGNSEGQDDGDYPARAIGEILVLQTGEQACLGIVSFSIHEFGIGDRVIMRKGQ